MSFSVCVTNSCVKRLYSCHDRWVKACGKDSVEYNILQKGLDANNAIHDFEKTNPSAKEQWYKYQDLVKKDETGAKEYFKSLSKKEQDSVLEYDDLFQEYYYSQIEVEARSAAKNKFKFFGKDVKDYGTTLERVHGRRIGKVRKGNPADVKANANGGADKLLGRTSRSSGHDDGSYSDVQRPNNGYNPEKSTRERSNNGRNNGQNDEGLNDKDTSSINSVKDNNVLNDKTNPEYDSKQPNKSLKEELGKSKTVGMYKSFIMLTFLSLS